MHGAGDPVSDQATRDGPLAVICGGGTLPYAVADAVLRRGRKVFLLPIRGWADPAAVGRYPHAWLSVGQAGRFLTLARGAGCRDLVCVGTLLRPAFRHLRLDLTTVRLLPRLYRMFRGGDDHLLSGVGRLFEELGFRLLGAHEVAPEILVPAGSLGARAATTRDLADAEIGFAVIEALGRFDIGQAVVVADRRVVAVEAAEGTDAMLARVAALREEGRLRLDRGIGVLVKAPKPQQDRRMDLPTVGLRTLAGIAAAGLAGMVLRAREVIVAEPQAVAAEADRLGLFAVGLGAAGDAATPAQDGDAQGDAQGEAAAARSLPVAS